MTTTNKEAKDFHKMLDKLKTKHEQAEAQSDAMNEECRSGKAYREFLKFFYKGKIGD
jgi:intergrase/recombinase